MLNCSSISKPGRYGWSSRTTILPGYRPMPNNNAVVTARRIDLGLNEGTLGLFAAAILLVGAVLWSAHGPNVEKTDFSLTYVGARIVHQGLGSRLYDISL